jgi:hypothetical protein
MKKVALGMAAAATALAGPAMARDNYAYFGADFGYADPEDHDIANNGWDDGSYILEDDGFDLGAFIGYDWGAIRTEAELSYKEFDPKGVNIGWVGAPLFNGSAPFDSGLYKLAFAGCRCGPSVARQHIPGGTVAHLHRRQRLHLGLSGHRRTAHSAHDGCRDRPQVQVSQHERIQHGGSVRA